ncbi:MAG: tetratricopeptide repeat protein [Candidatus Anammoximicrobium sp.]|nr:tetratricopeptide repeat protein [Candidatus Anammoximicrobium sp.]
MRTGNSVRARQRVGGAILLAAAWWTAAAEADVATLRNGMQFEGSIGKIGSLGEDPLNPQSSAGQVKVRQIVFVDDNLRRTFFSQIQTQAIVPGQANVEKIRVEQRVAKGTRRVAAVGPIIRITPFDEWGRRIFTMSTGTGPIDVIQGITEVTPVYTRVEGLAARSAYVWDMRIATSSIPRDTLSKILLKAIDPQDADQRLRLVRLYIQSERYTDARAELQSVIAEFPDLADLNKQVTALYQAGAKRMIQEIELRRKSGQHRLAYSMLERFPAEGVAGELLLLVRDMLEEYAKFKEQGEQTLARLAAHAAEVKDSRVRGEFEPLVEEIKADLNLTTYDRLADYLRLANDPALSAEQKLALAVSGWLLGAGSGDQNVAVATSLIQVRKLVRQYMASPQQAERDGILGALASLEGSSPSYLAKVLAQMKPPVETEAQADSPPGWYELVAAGLTGEPDIPYYVQLPPEYDPYRRYPCVVTLNGAGTTPQQQIDWWAGMHNEQAQIRLGQAARHGYIVLAPQWTRPHQLEYGSSAREHAAVLYPLRDACRRFSIDTDRVFLSGHSMGGDAAWDLGLAHPDLWAGIIPIVATADKYVSRYWENGRYLPMYFVAGEMDGDKMSRNSMDWDRYLNKHTYDATVVVYQGRGHEHFIDEIQRLFSWMDLHRRQFFPREFECVSMRPWDNFFWWAELESLPSRSVVLPVNWPPPSGVRPARTEGRILENSRVTLRSGADRAAVWLSPEMVDFSQRVSVTINGRSYGSRVEPRAEVLLEDARTRGDRQHPFWARVDDSDAR